MAFKPPPRDMVIRDREGTADPGGGLPSPRCSLTHSLLLLTHSSLVGLQAAVACGSFTGRLEVDAQVGDDLPQRRYAAFHDRHDRTYLHTPTHTRMYIHTQAQGRQTDT
eukprot:GHVU01028969.1.p2 GENE.GHVU01028969.1~~GHVU01028969.1.p2  ORF type:complete len:109 (-),score=6.91 GHVU01028969.1:58-384(-)